MKNAAEILCIGTELLLGNIVNTNAQFISQSLAEIGVNVYYHTVVGDNPQRLRQALHTAFSRCDILICTGGLGPTYDDLTKETIAGYFGLQLELHEESLQNIKGIMQRFGQNMTENNIKQAMMPRGALVLPNPNGTAPGVLIEAQGKTAILLPGPPREMTAMLKEQVMPHLAKRAGLILRSHYIHFFGIGESRLESMLTDRMREMTNPTLASYAKEGEVMLRVTASAQDDAAAQAMMKPMVEQLFSLFGRYIYGMDTGTLENTAVLRLTEKGLTVATAESCTGGLLAKRLTDVAGASQVFGFGAVSYADSAKEKLLGVLPQTLAAHGAVSAQVAMEMARGVRAASGADIGIALTGVAGPGGGSAEKPVGLVYLGLDCEKRSEVMKLRLSRGYQDERSYIRLLASSNALFELIRTCELY